VLSTGVGLLLDCVLDGHGLLQGFELGDICGRGHVSIFNIRPRMD